MSTDQRSGGPIKVSDKRIFTAEGELREEYRESLDSAAPEPKASPPPATPNQSEGSEESEIATGRPEERTAFSGFVEGLVFNAYMNLGMIQNPYQPGGKADLNGARQMIDILDMLKEKTRGNLTKQEEAFLNEQLAELKLAWVRVSKAI